MLDKVSVSQLQGQTKLKRKLSFLCKSMVGCIIVDDLKTWAYRVQLTGQGNVVHFICVMRVHSP